ncbi:MAG: succinate dehydrogenase [Pirellulales bacterium]|nr:succinate dehydrogenase [Pirellulales bacterium]
MSQSSGKAPPAPWQFLLYRLFSLSGIVPIGGFVVVHLSTNASTLSGPAAFQNNVNLIHGLGPILPLVEWLFIFGPMIFHALVGFLVISGAVVNVGSYPFVGNIRYTLQRVTGVIAFFFIIWHVLHMHAYGAPLGKGFGEFDPHFAASSAAEALHPAFYRILYAIGVIAVSYHLANGIWTFGCRWGIWTSEAAMQRATYAVLVLGLGITAIGLAAIYGVSSTDPATARQIEQRIYDQRNYIQGKDLQSGGHSSAVKSSGVNSVPEGTIDK